MKFLMVPLCSLALISCTQNNKSATYSASNITAASSQASFGENLEFGAKVADQIFTFTKSASESSADSTVALTSADNAFSIVSATGCNKSLTKASNKCLVKVRFNSSKVSGAHSGVLSVGSGAGIFSLNLTATVLPDTSAVTMVSFSEGGIAASSLSFGEVEAKGSLSKIITVLNSGSKDVTPVVSLTGDSNFSILSNACSTALKSGKSCLVKLSFKGDSSAPSQVASKTASLVVSGISLPLSGSLKALEAPTAAVLKLYESSSEIDSVDFGQMTLNTTQSKVLTLKNEGGSTATPQVSVSGSDFTISTTGCASLKPGASCFIRLTAQAKESSGSENLSIAGNSILLAYNTGGGGGWGGHPGGGHGGNGGGGWGGGHGGGHNQGPSRPLYIDEVVNFSFGGFTMNIGGDARSVEDYSSSEADDSQWFLDGVELIHDSSGTSKVYSEKGRNRIAANIDFSTISSMPNVFAAAVGTTVDVELVIVINSSEGEELMSKTCSVTLLRNETTADMQSYSCPIGE